jgi:hypothetical protein
VTGGAFAVPVTASLAVDDNAVSPGVLGFVVVALLGVATYLLIRSMNRQIKQIDLPDDDAPADQRNGDDPGDVPPVDDDQPQR